MASKLKIAGTAAGILGLVAFSILKPSLDKSEGTVYVDYYDPLGIPTACNGHTGPDVHIGRHRSETECDELERADVERTWAGMTQCITNDHMLPREKAAFTSLAYNIGVTAFCGSTALKKINADDMHGACEAILMWNLPAELRGIAIRRKNERAMCLGEGKYGGPSNGSSGVGGNSRSDSSGFHEPVHGSDSVRLASSVHSRLSGTGPNHWGR